LSSIQKQNLNRISVNMNVFIGEYCFHISYWIKIYKRDVFYQHTQ
jgi:hypothetical protein